LPEEWKELIIVPIYKMGIKQEFLDYIKMSLLLKKDSAPWSE
jgi:hypothetical protein